MVHAIGGGGSGDRLPATTGPAISNSGCGDEKEIGGDEGAAGGGVSLRHCGRVVDCLFSIVYSTSLPVLFVGIVAACLVAKLHKKAVRE